MSITVTTRRVARRGIRGPSPFMSELSESAGVAIGTAIAAGRAGTFFDAAAATAPAEGSPTYDSAPTSTTIMPDELGCECVTKRALEAMTNLGITPPPYDETLVQCEADPDSAYATIASFFPDGEIPMCAWYELPRKRTKALIAAAAVGGVAAVGFFVMRGR